MNLLRPFPIVAFLLFGLLSLNSCNQSEKKATKITKDSLKRRSIKDWNKTIPGNFNSEQELFLTPFKLSHLLLHIHYSKNTLHQSKNSTTTGTLLLHGITKMG
ncbi:hypothetical protein [Pedobacter panaciterrae]